MSDKKSDMDEVRDLWEKEQDKKDRIRDIVGQAQKKHHAT